MAALQRRDPGTKDHVRDPPHLRAIFSGPPRQSPRRPSKRRNPAAWPRSPADVRHRQEFNPAEWRSIFYQLHAADLIAQDPEDRDRWIITGTGRAVLSGEAPFTPRGDMTLSSGRKVGVRRSLDAIEVVQSKDPVLPREAFEQVKRGIETAPLTAQQNSLLAAFKAKRLEIARDQKQPAFVIFHDSVLIAMSPVRPKTREDLLLISGIGPAKATRFGAIFLALIAHNEVS
jgi:ATP-dependent DNA helicase RecQ